MSFVSSVRRQRTCVKPEIGGRFFSQLKISFTRVKLHLHCNPLATSSIPPSASLTHSFSPSLGSQPPTSRFHPHSLSSPSSFEPTNTTARDYKLLCLLQPKYFNPCYSNGKTKRSKINPLLHIKLSIRWREFFFKTLLTSLSYHLFCTINRFTTELERRLVMGLLGSSMKVGHSVGAGLAMHSHTPPLSLSLGTNLLNSQTVAIKFVSLFLSIPLSGCRVSKVRSVFPS